MGRWAGTLALALRLGYLSLVFRGIEMKENKVQEAIERETKDFLSTKDVKWLMDAMFAFINKKEYEMRYAHSIAGISERHDEMYSWSVLAGCEMNTFANKLRKEFENELDDMKWRITMLEEKTKDAIALADARYNILLNAVSAFGKEIQDLKNLKNKKK
jgi:hypothetical protein